MDLITPACLAFGGSSPSAAASSNRGWCCSRSVSSQPVVAVSSTMAFSDPTDMHIVFFSHYYPPEVNAPASRTSEHCREWVRQGHDVTVVTCAPNHPNGKLYPSYRNRFYQTERIDGVHVIRLWTFLAANEGFLLRTLNYVSYLVAAVLVLPTLRRPDVIVSTSPQFFCGLAGLAARFIKRAPWVLEIRDLWPESIVTVGAMRRNWCVRLLEA